MASRGRNHSQRIPRPLGQLAIVRCGSFFKGPPTLSGGQDYMLSLGRTFYGKSIILPVSSTKNVPHMRISENCGHRWGTEEGLL